MKEQPNRPVPLPGNAAHPHAGQGLPTHSPCSGQALKVGATSASGMGHWSLEMLKMKIDPGMCMKTQETMTKYLAKKQAFARKCTHCASALSKSDPVVFS